MQYWCTSLKCFPKQVHISGIFKLSLLHNGSFDGICLVSGGPGLQRAVLGVGGGGKVKRGLLTVRPDVMALEAMSLICLEACLLHLVKPMTLEPVSITATTTTSRYSACGSLQVLLACVEENSPMLIPLY